MTFHPLTQMSRRRRLTLDAVGEGTAKRMRYAGFRVYFQGQKVCLQQATSLFLSWPWVYSSVNWQTDSQFLLAPNINNYQTFFLKISCYLVEVFHPSPYPSMTSLHVGHIGFPIGDPLWTFLASPTSSSQSGLGFGIVSFHPHVLPRQRGVGSPIGYRQLLWWGMNLVSWCLLRFLSKVWELLRILWDSMNTLDNNNNGITHNIYM